MLYGISGLGIAIADMLIGHIDMINLDIRSGQFDVVLLRPVSTLLQVMASDLALRRLGSIAQATAVLVYALAVADIQWNALRVDPAARRHRVRRADLRRDVRARRVPHVLDGRERRGREHVHVRRQHVDVVSAQHLRAVAAAVARVRRCRSRSSTYFPGLYLLDKPDPLGFPTAFQFLAPVVALAFAALTGFAWRSSVRHYRSTGS